jgi:GH24 family phage-related lysozyme (muramidase)
MPDAYALAQNTSGGISWLLIALLVLGAGYYFEVHEYIKWRITGEHQVKNAPMNFQVYGLPQQGGRVILIPSEMPQQIYFSMPQSFSVVSLGGVGAASDLLELIKLNEGYRKRRGRHVVYIDQAGKCGYIKGGCPTVGYGHNLLARSITPAMIGRYWVGNDDSLSEHEATLLLKYDIAIVEGFLSKRYPWYRQLPKNAQTVMIDMAFNMGGTEFAKFERTFSLLKARKFKAASNNLAKAKYATINGKPNQRVLRLRRLLESI